MGATKRRPKAKSLAHGRPSNLKPAGTLSSKATRSFISTHHILEKQRSKALAEGDDITAHEISLRIDAQGGIKTYQRASLLGQGNERGGDSSKLLMDWLKPMASMLKERKPGGQLRLLEVGALSTTNSCSRSGLFDIERIDLNSQAEGITQQDFMERPLPEDESSRFDVISLSLVINFVPDAAARGEMLKRTLKFLRLVPIDGLSNYFPSLFLVIPASCVTNSRYMDETRLEDIMLSVGYVKLYRKLSNKLAYYLWKATNLPWRKQTETFKKTEVRAGKVRNNFAIVLH